MVFGVTFALCGVGAIMLGRNLSAEDRAIAAWPRAPGTITTSQLEDVKRSVRDARGFYYDTTVATPVIRFTYTVDGRELQSDQVSKFGLAFTTEPLSQYPLGQAVSVYYNPDDPKTGYLEAPQTPSSVLFTFMGSAFVLLGFAAVVGAVFLSTRASRLTDT